MGQMPQQTHQTRKVAIVRALERAPGAVVAAYLAVGAALVAFTNPVIGQFSLSSVVTLAGWLLFSGLLLYLVLNRLSLNSSARSDADARHALRQVENCLAAIKGSLPDALVMVDGKGTIRSFNPSAERLFGLTAAQARGRPLDGLLLDEHVGLLHAAFRHFATTGDAASLAPRREMLARRADGTTTPIELSMAPLAYDDEGGFVLVAHDIAARKSTQTRLDVAEKVLECTAEGVMVTDPKGSITWVNQGFCGISGYGRDEVLGRPAGILKSGLQGPEFYAAMWAQIRQGGEWAGEIWNRRKDGEAYPEWLTIKAIIGPSGQISSYVGVFSDISKHKRAEETIRTLTYYDAVTRLPNRYLFMDRLTQTIERGQRAERKAALVMIGLDRFRQINESLGHQTGDTLLRAVADRLAGVLRPHDSVARLRGDTFCCVLSELEHSHDAAPLISRLTECFDACFEVSGQELFVTSAMGISLFPADGTDPNELVQKAETAMNRSKEQADSHYQFYTPEMNANSKARLRLETELRKALVRDEFVVHYQPKVDTVTGQVVGAEALLRWMHGDLGLISPAEFIPIAEETGLIVPIGHWVLDHVCEQIRHWQEAGLAPVQIAVNLSAHQFRQPDLVQNVVAAFSGHGVDAALVELELTESAVMHNAETAIQTLMELHQHGIRLAVDDFGTGYSSLSYLKRFPIDKLKIDRAFVLDIDTNPASVEIVSAIIAMAHSLNLDVVAEGVETQGQLDILRTLKCDEIQGFFYSRPVVAEMFAAILKRGYLDGQAAG